MTLTVTMTNTWSTVLSPDLEELKFVDVHFKELLSYRPLNPHWIKQAKIKAAKKKNDKETIHFWENWDGVFSLYSNRSFPSGLIRRVLMKLENLKVGYTLDDQRNTPFRVPKDQRYSFCGSLREYQTDALEAFWRYGRGILANATGSGKTVTALKAAADSGTPVVILVPKLEIMNEWLYKAKEFTNRTIGFMGGAQCDPRLITVCSIQTAHNMLFKSPKTKSAQTRYAAGKQCLESAGMVIVDEAHHAASDSWFNVLQQMDAYYRMGLSGTIDKRTDRLDIKYYGAIGDVVHRITTSELVEMNHLVPAQVYFHKVPFLYFDKKTPWSDAEGTGVIELYIVNNVVRNDLIVREAYKGVMEENRQTVVFVERVEHGKILQPMIEQHHRFGGYSKLDRRCRVAFAWGSSKTRTADMAAFRAGDIDILILQYQMGGEGFDVPPLACLVMAMGGKSEISLIQRIGRGVRTDPGKSNVKIIDFADYVKYCVNHTRKRFHTYLEEPAFEVHVEGTWLASQAIGVTEVAT